MINTIGVKNKLITVLIFLMIVTTAAALNECDSVTTSDDVPCIILLPISNSTDCLNTTVEYYNESSLFRLSNMSQYNNYFCNDTFNFTDTGTYNFRYSTGDTGSIKVIESDNRYYLYVIALFMATILVIIGFKMSDIWVTVLAGFIFGITGVNLIINGYPGVNNIFIQQGIGIVLLGLSFVFALIPIVQYLEVNYP